MPRLPTLSGRHPTALTPSDQDISDAAVEVFAGALGGRQALADLLSFSDDPRVADALSYLAEPPHGPGVLSIRQICRRAGLTVADLFRAFLDATLLKAKIATAPIIAAKLCATTQALMDASVDRIDRCLPCQGTGTVTTTPDPTTQTPHPRPVVLRCDVCHGLGTVTREPDLERQKVALQLGGLLKQPGASVQTQVNVTTPVVSRRTYEQEQADADTWLRESAVVEGAVVPPDPPNADTAS